MWYVIAKDNNSLFTAPKYCFGSLKMSNVRAEIQDECLEIPTPFYP